MNARVLARIAGASLRNRLAVVALTALSIALSVFLLVGVEKVRQGARASFLATISGTDLIVGARASDVQLLLHSVFHLGEPTAEIATATFDAVAARPDVAWAVPVSLGDGHRGYRVVGTTPDYFARIRTGRDRPLSFARGGPFADLFDIVLGAEVARALGYAPGEEIVLSHGTGRVDFTDSHADDPFRVSGVLAPTGTPIDRTLLVSWHASAAIHDEGAGAEDGARPPSTVTAVFVGLRSRAAAFKARRELNAYEGEPVSAVLPGLAFARLWSIVGRVEAALVAVSALVAATACLGLTVAVLSSLEGRRREMAILRAVGAGPGDVLALLMVEALAVTLAGLVAGVALAYGALLLGGPLVEAWAGIGLVPTGPSGREWTALALVALGGVLAGLVPAWRAYRMSLADGLTVRG